MGEALKRLSKIWGLRGQRIGHQINIDESIFRTMKKAEGDRDRV
jgi:hypothetical protein